VEVKKERKRRKRIEKTEKYNKKGRSSLPVPKENYYANLNALKCSVTVSSQKSMKAKLSC